MTACCVFFAYGTEGWPTSYAVEILRGETVVYTDSVENNTASSIMLTGLQIASPDAVRVTITAWSRRIIAPASPKCVPESCKSGRNTI